MKQPEKYQLLNIECEAQKDVLNSLVPTNLKPFKHGLMRLICDEKAMKDTMLSFDLDSANMPLGKFIFFVTIREKIKNSFIAFFFSLL